MRKVSHLLVLLMMTVLLSGCRVAQMIMEGVEAYNLGREAGRLSNAQIEATAHAKALTAIPLTQQAQTATVTVTSTLSPGETREATEIPAAPPTPVPIKWVKPKPGRTAGGAWFRFYNKPGLVEVSSTGTITGGYYWGSSIWDEKSESGTTSSSEIFSLGVIGSYEPSNAPLLPVIATASGEEFFQVIITVYVEISDFTAALIQTEGIMHDWGHTSAKHAHLWPEPDSSDQRKVIGFLEPGVFVSGPDPSLQLLILEITPDGRMVKVMISGVWMDSDDTEEVESP